AGRASNAALEDLRSQIVSYRQGFLEARDRNSARIATVQSQLDALGPPPEDGVSEAEEVAILRANLNQQLTQFRVPIVVSQEAYNRANGLITEIDSIIRERQAEALLKRGPSPLNPSHLVPAVEDLFDALRNLAVETRVATRNAIQTGEFQNALPAVVILTGVGFLLLLRGGRWSQRAGSALTRVSHSGQSVWEFFVSLGRIVLPLLGLFCIVAAVSVSSILGLRGQLVLESVVGWGALLIGFKWLAAQVFPKTGDPLIPVSAARARSARRNFFAAGFVLVFRDFASIFEQIENASEPTKAVLVFPIIIVAAAVLLRTRQVAFPSNKDMAELAADGSKPGILRIATGLRLMCLSIGIVAPVLAAFGYSQLAEALVFPAIATLAVFALVMVLQEFLSNIYGWLTGKGEAASESLFPALVGFAVSISSLPLLALIWGAREADLTELWQRFLQGFEIGDTRISPTDFLAFVVVFLVGYGLTRALQGALANNLLPRTRLDQGGQTAVVSGVGYVGIFLAALIAISTAGIDLSSIAIVAGALSVGIGFGLQTIVQNFVSGIILLVERPISKGDWIEVNGQMGYVRDISVRATRIETFDRTDVIVPNADFISGTVTNYTRGDTVGRLILPVGVAYGTDTRRVEAILREIAEAHPMVLATPPPSIVFQGFGADSLDFEIRAILRDVNWILSVKTEMNHQIAARFT
ncbi:MAG: DUF3772 domain-containing protein, partial [Pseudomonadota bacterium]